MLSKKSHISKDEMYLQLILYISKIGFFIKYMFPEANSKDVLYNPFL